MSYPLRKADGQDDNFGGFVSRVETVVVESEHGDGGRSTVLLCWSDLFHPFLQGVLLVSPAVASPSQRSALPRQ